MFDLGGVILDLDRNRAVKRFEAIGVKDAGLLIDPYEQKGIFLELENGKITWDEFCDALCEHAGRTIAKEEIKNAWLGFIVDTPQYKLDYILSLKEHYTIYLLSNTNPAIMEWAHSKDFSEAGHPITRYFHKLYKSYEIGVTKPAPEIFSYIINDSGMEPENTLFIDDGKSNVEVANKFGFKTYMPLNKEDWREAVSSFL